MDTPKSRESQNISRRLPVVTLLVVGAAVMVAQFPAWSPWLIYDRDAILSGQIWRMFTGHWVHFSASHLVYDSMVMGIAGWMIEAQKLRNYGWICLLAPWLISGVLLLVAPHMEQFGGLSALATAAVIYLALSGLRDGGAWHWVCVATLFGTVGKIVLEIVTGRMLFATTENHSVVISTASHVCGVLIALMFYWWTKVGATRTNLHHAEFPPA